MTILYFSYLLLFIDFLIEFNILKRFKENNENTYFSVGSENKFLKFIIDNKYEEILIDYMEKENQNRNQNAVEVEKRLLQIHMSSNKLEPVSKKRL